jgi:hypothetical protein
MQNALQRFTTHVIFEPLDFIAKLATLVPKPRVNLTRFRLIIASTEDQVVIDKILNHLQAKGSLPPTPELLPATRVRLSVLISMAWLVCLLPIFPPRMPLIMRACSVLPQRGERNAGRLG